ncbi:MAG TPA: hypothetical protein VKF79_04550 [Candidatus Acidoferrum sp.]|nr:hypothetical protein [Candidatus Acidoferrum sp.]
MRFWVSASAALLVCAAAFAQAPNSAKQAIVKAHRFNELTLAGLRPGRDKAGKAIQLFGKPDVRSSDKQSLSWAFESQDGAYYLNLDVDKMDVVQSVRVSHGPGPSGIMLPKHNALFARKWESGRGLEVGAPGARVATLYGEPDSRSPSTKDGRRLELLYYAFDWAGADVPQVMEVVCTVNDDGKSGRVVEITLAAPSL